MESPEDLLEQVDVCKPDCQVVSSEMMAPIKFQIKPPVSTERFSWHCRKRIT